MRLGTDNQLAGKASNMGMAAKHLRKAVRRVAPEYVIHALAMARAKEPLMPILAKHVEGGTFVDVGANIGVYTHALRSVASKVVAFEPVTALADALRRRYPQVEVYSCALSAASGSAVLHIPSLQREAVLTRASLNADANPGFSLEEVTVERRTLDSFALSNVRAIKIDVEGHEEEVLRGALETIKATYPALLVEIEERHHPGKSAALMQWIESLGYISYFHDGRSLTSAAAHDFAAWQPASAVKDAFKSGLASYVNNFLFLRKP